MWSHQATTLDIPQIRPPLQSADRSTIPKEHPSCQDLHQPTELVFMKEIEKLKLQIGLNLESSQKRAYSDGDRRQHASAKGTWGISKRRIRGPYDDSLTKVYWMCAAPSPEVPKSGSRVRQFGNMSVGEFWPVIPDCPRSPEFSNSRAIYEKHLKNNFSTIIHHQHHRRTHHRRTTFIRRTFIFYSITVDSSEVSSSSISASRRTSRVRKIALKHKENNRNPGDGDAIKITQGIIHRLLRYIDSHSP